MDRVCGLCMSVVCGFWGEFGGGGFLCVCCCKLQQYLNLKKSKENHCLPKFGSNGKDWVLCHLP